MTADPALQTPVSRTGRIQLAGAALLAACAVIVALSPRWLDPLREAWFDAGQRVAPRSVAAMPATVVEIDAKSLAELGRWPWPRSLLADLVGQVGAHRPAAVGLDILMPERDPLSPDALLARALAAVPAVLAVAGLHEPGTNGLRAPPFVIADASGADGAKAGIERFTGALTSTDEINRAAAGWGLVSAEPAAGVMRRVPLVAEVSGTLIAAMAIEMFRVAAGARALRLVVDGTSVRGIAIGPAFVPTERDGSARPYYSPRHASRFVSAVDVLRGRADPGQLRDKLVLIAVTGLGLADYHYTPVGDRMSGSEIHAQLLENLYEGTLLSRPAWAPWLEAAAITLLGALLIRAVPRWKPRNATLLALGCLALLVVASYATFRASRVLLDAATPIAALLLVFGTLALLTLAETMRHRRALEIVAYRERVRSARLAGELDAARRIQMATLPRADLLRDARLDLAAFMSPAREVGGDLYDFFRLDDDRLFLLVGDVAGKGLSASIFMAVSKALCKSAALRSAAPDLGALMMAANTEVSRDNPELLFVSAFAATLDLCTGALAYCNAGHENPCLLRAVEPRLSRIADGDGPPLCAIDGFRYAGARVVLAPGEILCLVSDGVTEAQNPAGELYGNARLEAVLLGVYRRDLSAGDIVKAVRDDVATFAQGAEPSDDFTVLVLRWRGPQPR